MGNAINHLRRVRGRDLLPNHFFLVELCAKRLLPIGFVIDITLNKFINNRDYPYTPKNSYAKEIGLKSWT